MKLALGTVQFGLTYGIANRHGQVGFEEAKAIVRYAHRSGFDTLDTAVNYGDSEHYLGKIGVSDWQVISKLPALPDQCEDISRWIRNQVEASLERMHLTNLQGLLLHRPDQLLGKHGKEIYQGLHALKQDGLVEKIGISIYDPIELDVLISNFNMDLVQAPFNVLDQRLITSGWMHKLMQMGIELHTRSVFLQGLLLMSPRLRPAYFNRWHSTWEIWEQWLIETGLTPQQACLSYAVSQIGIARVIVGVDNINQLKEIEVFALGSVPELPRKLISTDIDLINPGRWANV